MKKKILGIIPARGGSKGIPGKNIKNLAGTPLLGHIFQTAKACEQITDIILSTEDSEIAAVGKELGLSVPFLRPKELATDEAKSIDVVLHAFQEMEKRKGETYDFGILLQPTCPLTQLKHIEEALNLLQEKNLESVTSLTEVGHFHPGFMFVRDGNSFRKLLTEKEDYLSREELPDVFVRSGNIYAFSREFVFHSKKLLGEKTDYIFVEKQFAINIDDDFDWNMAEAFVSKYSSLKEEKARV